MTGSAAQGGERQEEGVFAQILKLYGYTLGPVFGVISLLSLTEQQFDWSEIAGNWIEAFRRVSDGLWSWLPLDLSSTQTALATGYFLFLFPAYVRFFLSVVAPGMAARQSGIFSGFANFVVFAFLLPLLAILFLEAISAGLIVIFGVYTAVLFGAVLLALSLRMRTGYLLQVGIVLLAYVGFVVLGIQGGILG